MLFKLEKVGKEFGGEWLFRDISLQANVGEHIGLIGRNGAGKTTLFCLIEGSLKPDEGNVVRASGLQIGRVKQIADLSDERTVFSEANSVFSELRDFESRLRELEHQISVEGTTERTSREYESLRMRLDFSGGYDHEAHTEKILFGLGFSSEDLTRLCRELSGGQRSRLLLAKTLLKPANLLLLDEPTNHLDLSGIIWLVEFLRSFKGSLLLISHDRYFLDQVTDRTWEIAQGRAHEYPCSFSRSRELRREKIRQQRAAYEREQEWKRQTEEFIRRNIVGQKTKQAQARRKQLEKTNWLQPPLEEETASPIRIPEAGRGGALTFSLEGGEIGFLDESGPKVLVSGVNLTARRGDRIAILGGNGTGKTTLLRTLLGEHPLLGGELRWGVNNLPAYFSQESRFQEEEQSVFDVLAEVNPSMLDEEIRGFAARFLFRQSDVFKKVAQLSGGERTRLALARLFSRSANVLLMDEPTNHLDIQSREALEAGLKEFGGTLVVTSHDLYFVRELADRLYLIEEGCWSHLDRLSELRERLQKPDRPGSDLPTGTDQPEKAAARDRSEKASLSKNERMRLKRRIESLESEIETLENKRSEIETDLQDRSSDHVQLIDLSREHRAVEGKLKTLYQEWEKLGRHLESSQ